MLPPLAASGRSPLPVRLITKLAADETRPFVWLDLRFAALSNGMALDPTAHAAEVQTTARWRRKLPSERPRSRWAIATRWGCRSTSGISATSAARLALVLEAAHHGKERSGKATLHRDLLLFLRRKAHASFRVPIGFGPSRALADDGDILSRRAAPCHYPESTGKRSGTSARRPEVVAGGLVEADVLLPPTSRWRPLPLRTSEKSRDE